MDQELTSEDLRNEMIKLHIKGVKPIPPDPPNDSDKKDGVDVEKGD